MIGIVSVDDLVVCFCGFNAYVGRYIDGFDGFHGRHDVGKRNFKGSILLEVCLEKELCVSNTWFKREEKLKVTFRFG